MASTATPRIGIILGSTRDSRFAEKPASWIRDFAADYSDELEFETVDIRDYDLPFFNEVASNLWVPSKDPNAIRWQEKLDEFDGFIFVTAEYNHSIPGALKNAIDQAYMQWVKKPMAVVGYGGVGAARATEHLRGIAVELQMVPVRQAVHIGGSEFMKVSPMGEDGAMSEIGYAIEQPARDMLDNLAWWAKLTKKGRAEDEAQREAA